VPDDCKGLWEIGCAQSGTGRPRRANGRSGSDGASPAGRDELGTGLESLESMAAGKESKSEIARFPRSNTRLETVMLDAFSPCDKFGLCPEATWDPEKGYVPRGFLGATGSLRDVEAIFVFAEPGHPHSSERYNPDCSPIDLMRDGQQHAYKSFKFGEDLFHSNVRWLLDQLWPNLGFDDQLSKVWLTESRLCSIDNEIGNFRDKFCALKHLSRQIALMPAATVIAFGGKAKSNLSKLSTNYISAYALAPPGANHKPARPSWMRAISMVQERRSYEYSKKGAKPCPST